MAGIFNEVYTFDYARALLVALNESIERITLLVVYIDLKFHFDRFIFLGSAIEMQLLMYLYMLQ